MTCVGTSYNLILVIIRLYDRQVQIQSSKTQSLPPSPGLLVPLSSSTVVTTYASHLQAMYGRSLSAGPLKLSASRKSGHSMRRASWNWETQFEWGQWHTRWSGIGYTASEYGFGYHKCPMCFDTTTHWSWYGKSLSDRPCEILCIDLAIKDWSAKPRDSCSQSDVFHMLLLEHDH